MRPFHAAAVYRDLLMSLRQLKWLAILAPAVLVTVLEVARFAVMGEFLGWQQRLLLDAVAAITLVILYSGIFRMIGQMQGRLRRQNQELIALHTAGIDVASELSLDVLLKKVVDQASSLLDAKYGALSVVDSNGRIETFITSGITEEERAKLGPPPVGHGVLGVVLTEGRTLRLDDLARHPRSVGFPPNHPPMKTLLAVPVDCRSPFRGNLYVAEKAGGRPFTEDDEDTLERFAVQVARAIDNAFLHQQVRDLAISEERLRIAHEMHDGIAQVLGYVNTKVLAANEYLRQEKVEAAQGQLKELSSAAREAYTDVRESIAALRSLPHPDRTFEEVIREYIERWREQAKIQTNTHIEGEIRVPVAAELQILRIVQESLANVRKHARAKNVSVELRQSGAAFELLVRDDGIGFDPEAKTKKEFPRFGLTTMRERAASIGAALRIDAQPGAGTSVSMRLPLGES